MICVFFPSGEIVVKRVSGVPFSDSSIPLEERGEEDVLSCCRVMTDDM